MTPSIPILDLHLALDEEHRPKLLAELRDALFNIGFLYVKNHGIEADTISNLANQLPALFDLPSKSKIELSKTNSPHFLGYNGFAEETTAGHKDLREQFDFATELPVIWDPDFQPMTGSMSDFSKAYWRMRGPNQWPSEAALPGFRKALTEYARGSSLDRILTTQLPRRPS
jgi:isopenicillin N synthase-like dioxygenase